MLSFWDFVTSKRGGYLPSRVIYPSYIGLRSNKNDFGINKQLIKYNYTMQKGPMVVIDSLFERLLGQIGAKINNKYTWFEYLVLDYQ